MVKVSETKSSPEPTTQTHEEDLLDEALEESFPASDPPAAGHSHDTPNDSPSKDDEPSAKGPRVA